MNASALLIAAVLLRNPFWPIDYEGEREEITAESRAGAKTPADAQHEEVLTAGSQAKTNAEKARLALEQAEAAEREREEAERRELEDTIARTWIAARESLKFGGTVRARQADGSTKSSVFINGRDYSDGDVISVNHNGFRLTWRVTGLNDKGHLQLERLRWRQLEKKRNGNGNVKGKNK